MPTPQRAVYIVVAAAIALAGCVSAQRASLRDNGTQAPHGGSDPSITDDGRSVAFTSLDHLSADDSNLVSDIYVRDLVGGHTTLVTLPRNGVPVNGPSLLPAISGDGRYVAFISRASNLVDGDDNGKADVFVRDLTTDTTTRVSVDSNGVGGDGDAVIDIPPAISDDGRFVAFCSRATNLVANDTNGATDIFLHDMTTGATTRVSESSTGGQADFGSAFPDLTGDGRYVVFFSYASTLVPDSPTGFADVFVHDNVLGTTARVSVDSEGGPPDGPSTNASISGDGRYVAFVSYATDIAPCEAATANIFLHDAVTGVTTCLTFGDLDSLDPKISEDGRYVVFRSRATDLVPRKTNGLYDIFVYDTSTHATRLMTTNAAGDTGNKDSLNPTISGDGEFVAYQSSATNLVSNDTNAWPDVFVRPNS